MKNIDYIISIAILEQKGEFDDMSILNSIKIKNSSLFQNMEITRDLINKKIKALWKANVLTYNGFSLYYVNDNYKNR